MEKTEYIYIVLVKSLTKLGKISRAINNYEYTHMSVSLDDKLEEFISFSRKKHYAPFDSGFMREKVEHYAFGNNKEIKLKVFAIPVSKEIKENIESYICKIENDAEYIFNLYSMITMPLLHGVKIYKAHNCMSFIGKILELTNSVNMEKEYYKYSIEDIDKLLSRFAHNEQYIQKKKDDTEYMKKVGLLINAKQFFELNVNLIYRIIAKRNE